MTPIIFGLILLGTIGIMILIVLYMVYGRSEKKSEKQKRYDCAHATIYFLMEHGIVNRPGYKFIRDKFAEIAHYPCNREELQVKEMEFLKCYYEFVPDVCVTSFNGTLEKRNIKTEDNGTNKV